ncbi:uncharacterized protein LOC143880299 [Tasmannia lanceolata]|uniref:uncharacterized protein LOC143880299 n=1 Tax=Tasmannia lanceolata TaxID=3420 RepID=UPI0040629E0F
MEKSSKTITHTLYSLYLHGISSKPTSKNAIFSHILSPIHHSYPRSLEISLRRFSHISSSTHRANTQNLLKNYSSSLIPYRFLSSRYLSFKISSKLDIGKWASVSKSSGSSKINWNPLGSRFFSFRRAGGGKSDGNFAESVINKPLSAVRSSFSRYREAVGLQIEAFVRRNSLVLMGAGGVVVCILLWRLMFGVANTFIGLSQGMAKYGFLAFASAIVAFAGLYLRSRFAINPDRIYRMAMRKLNTSAGILEVMGAPLSGTDLRAYVMSGGGLRVKNFKPTLSGKRCFLIFPIQGFERKGLVSVEVKKKNGQHDMKLLAVDIPMASGPDQRLFLIGDEEEYKIGGGLISELRDPIVKAMAAQKEFDDLDQKEEEDDAKRELEEAERKQREEVEKLEKGSL